MRNSIIAVLAVVLLAHASGGSVQTARAQQVPIEPTPLRSIVLHDSVGVDVDSSEAQHDRLFTTQRSFHSAQIFRDVDTVRPQVVRRVTRAAPPDEFPFAWTVADPGITRTHLFAIGGGFALHGFPHNAAFNMRLAALHTGLSFDSFAEGCFSVRAFLPWGITLGAETAKRVADAFVRYELRVIGGTRLFAGIGFGRTEHLVENVQSLAAVAARGLLLHAGIFIPLGVLAFEVSTNYCDVSEQHTQFRTHNTQSNTYELVDVWFDPSRSSLRLQLFVLF